MKEIDKLARRIASNIQDDNKNYAFDPILILTIISVIIGIIRLMMSCNLFGRSIENRIKNPGPIDKILLKRAVRKELGSGYSSIRPQLEEQILNEAKKLDSTQLSNLIEEVKNG